MQSNEEDLVCSGVAWTTFCHAIERAGHIILRPNAPNTPLDRAEGFRYLTRLLRGYLYQSIENADPEFPHFRDYNDLVKIGADNPDNVYLSAPIRGDREYRIIGNRGSIHYFSIGSKANRYAVDGTMASTGELNDEDLVVESDGSVEIIASARPQPKNWLPLAADSTLLVVRQSYLKRESERPGHYRIECLNGSAVPPPLSAAELARGLKAVAQSVTGTAETFAQWAELFMTRPNELPDFGQEMFQRAGGDPEIFYLHGYWELGRDQAWVIHTEVPECRYWNFQLNNWWMESLDYRYHKISVNMHTARLNPDGSLTIVVAARDPGWGNWIDTTKHRSGTALLRWLGASHHPIPRCQVVDLEVYGEGREIPGVSA